MEINEYQQRAMSTCMPTSDNPMYMLLGLAEECGELCGKVSKAIRKGQITIDGNHFVSRMSADDYHTWMELVVKELGDCLWMCAGVAHTLGLPLNFITDENLNKLASRRERGVIDGNGDSR